MDQLLRMAKSLHIPRWRTLRIKVSNAKKNTEAEFEQALADMDAEEAGVLAHEMRTLTRVLVWMESIEEELAPERPQAHSQEFSGPGIGEWDDLSTW